MTRIRFDGIPAPSQLMRYTPSTGDFELAFPTDFGLNGLAVRIDGALIGASHGIGALVEIDTDTGMATTLVSDSAQRFNSPNDLSLKADENIYFTDPDFQAPPDLVRDTAAYRVSPDGIVEMIAGTGPADITQPNGISLSPAEDRLYIAHQNGVKSVDLAADGSVVDGSISDFGPPGLEVVDGLAIDCAGNVYVTLFTIGEVRVIAPSGDLLGTIELRRNGVVIDGSLTNAAFGGADNQTLFLTAGDDPSNEHILFSVDLPVPGLPY